MVEIKGMIPVGAEVLRKVANAGDAMAAVNVACARGRDGTKTRMTEMYIHAPHVTRRDNAKYAMEKAIFPTKKLKTSLPSFL